MNRIVLEEKYDYTKFSHLSDELVRKEEGILAARSMVLDLSDVTFIDPFGMISIIGVCRHVYNKYGVHSNIVLPNGDAGSYMERAGFLAIQDQDYFIEVSRKKTLQQLSRFIFKSNNLGVLFFFNSEKDIGPINEEVDIWMEDNSFSEGERNSISTFISEMAQNVTQHSYTPQLGVLCIQSYVSRKGDAFLAWAIGDSGIGIKKSLLDAGIQGIKLLEDSKVIHEVVSKGMSRFQDDITRGNGLSSLYKAAQKRKTDLCIHSHEGIFGWRKSTKNFEIKIPSVIGTNVTLYLSQEKQRYS